MTMMDAVIQFRGTIYEDGYGLIAQKVMRDSSISATAKAVYAYLCSFAGVGKDGERTAFPGVELMMNDLSIKSEDTFYKYRKELVTAGYITIEKVREKGKFERNLYFINAVPTDAVHEEKPHPKFSGMDEPHPKLSSTVKSSAENRGTNSIRSTSTSFNKKKERRKEGSAVAENDLAFEMLKSKSEKLYVNETETAANHLKEIYVKAKMKYGSLKAEIVEVACDEWMNNDVRHWEKNEFKERYEVGYPANYFLSCYEKAINLMQISLAN
jgi:hypothetical protein